MGFAAQYDKLVNFDVTSLFQRPGPLPKPRTVYISQDLPDEAYNFSKKGKRTIKPDYVYSTNQVVTSKYTVVTFLPRNLLEQFRRVANIFFLGIAILQFFPKFSTISPGLVILPLIAVLAITAAKDAYEDVKRHQSDRHVNHTKTHVIEGNGFFNPNVMSAKSKTFTPGIPKVMKRKGKPVDPEALIEEAERAEAAGQGGVDIRPGMTRTSTNHSRRIERRNTTLADEFQDSNIPHWEKTIWEDVKVGDFILLHSDDPVPADIIVCATSEPEQVAFVETKNLDGETNLKSRHAVPELTHLATPDQIIQGIKGDEAFRIEAEPADVNMYKMNGAVVMEKTGERFPIDIQTVLLRGTVLRNTEWLVGVVLYTGGDTKIVMNSGQTPSKRSRVERQMNPMVFLNLILLAVMAIVCAVVDSILEHRNVHKDAYWLYNDNRSDDNPNINGVVTFANALITFQNVIPISLYISIEFVRTCQAAFIYFDSEMVYTRPGQAPGEGQATLARSWNLADDLGQIEYVFSDKTGTLTQNSMEFKQCSVGGKIYKGEPIVDRKSHVDGSPPNGARSLSSDGSTFAPEKETHLTPETVTPALSEPNAPRLKLSEGVVAHFHDPQLVADLKNSDTSPEAAAHSRSLNGFFATLALCHTVLASTDFETGAITYKAQSPDEAALVQAAADVGFVFLGREPSTQILRLRTPFSAEPERYELLNVLDFTSARKRMSVIVRKLGEGDDGDRRIFLLCKGADNVIFERLAPGGGDQFRDKTGEDLDYFASEGLRTLCLSYKVIPEEQYFAWDREYRDALVQLEDRDVHIEKISNEIEQNLRLLGATAIEDKLQEGVPETIADLKRAGIKVWVATGDKVETAIAIGYSTNLISRESNLILVRGGEFGSAKSAYAQMISAVEQFFPDSGILGQPSVHPPASDEERRPRSSTGSRGGLHRVNTGISSLVGEGNGSRPGGFVLVIDGAALSHALEEVFSKELLLQLSTRCEAVICCRVSPLQKALVVKLIKDGLGVMTLAIGDGANDVSMIQAADVGVGISGEEGLQAVNSSDYAIGQFRYLKRLLFVHGHWSYARNANMIVNFFYKNIMGIGVLWWFQIYCGWSTTYVFEYTYLLFWNVFWSLAPVIAIGIFDRNIDADILMLIPELYRYGRQAEWFGNKIFMIYVLDGVYQSAVIFFLILYAYKTTTARDDGYDVYMYEFSTTMVIAAVMVVNAYHGISTSAWTGWIWFSIAIGVVLIWIYTAIYSIIPPSLFYVPVYGNDTYLFPSAYYWFCILLTFCIAMLPRYLAKFYRLLYRPNDIDILRIVRKQHPNLDMAHHPLIAGHFANASHSRHPSMEGYRDPEFEEGTELRRPNMPAASGSHAPMGRRTDMSTGLQLTPSRGFDFSTEEGGVAIRRIQTGLSERHQEGVTGPSHPPARKRTRGSIHLFPALARSMRRKVRSSASDRPTTATSETLPEHP